MTSGDLDLMSANCMWNLLYMILVSSMKFVTPIVFKLEHISGATQKGGRDLWWLIFHPYTYEIISNPPDNNTVKFGDDTIRNEEKNVSQILKF